MLLTHWLKNLFRPTSRRSQLQRLAKLRKNRHHSTLPRQIEILEDRSLLSSYTVDLFTDEIDGDTSAGDLSLREAVQLANTDGVDSTITLAAGTYSLTIAGSNEDANLTGDLDVLADGSLTVIGAGAGQTIIDAGGSSGIRDRVFDTRTQMTLDGLTVRGGYLASDLGTGGENGDRVGGGIRYNPTNTGEALQILNSEFTGNTVGNDGWGGAIGSPGNLASSNRARVQLTNSIVSHNYSGRIGGGIRAYLVTATQTEFHNNRAAIDGGGISAFRVVVTDSTFRENYAAQFGAAIVTGSLQLDRVTFHDNEGPRQTIYSGGNGSLNEIKNSTFVGDAGDAYSSYGTSVFDSTPSHTVFTNTTIVASSRVGIRLINEATAQLNNTIVVGNGGQIFPEDIFGTVNASHSLIGSPRNNAGGVQHGEYGNIVGNNGVGVIDPTTVFVDVNNDGVINAADLADNGGPTLTLALRGDSPAVNAGSNTLASAAGLTNDQRGVGFPRVLGSIVDMGAFESEAAVNQQPNATDATETTDEDAGVFTLDTNLLVSDADALDVLAITSIVQDNGRSITFDDAGGVLNFDTDQFNDLAVGESETLVFTYTVDDQTIQSNSTNTGTLAITIEGRNDDIVLSGAVTATATENNAPFLVDLLAGASDPDSSDLLNISGLTLTGGDDSGVIINGSGLMIDPATYNHLIIGQQEVISYVYDISDGHGSSVPQTATITITGVNDYQGSYTVTVIEDENDGNYSASDLSLREAVLLANADGVDSTIHLGVGTYNLTINGSLEDAGLTGDLDVFADGSLTVLGQGAGQTIITAGGSTGIRDRVFDTRTQMTLDGLTVRGGYLASDLGTGGENGDRIGGGIRYIPTVSGEPLQILNSEITGNYVGSSGLGAGIGSPGEVVSTNETQVQLTNSVVSHNTSGYIGGGIRAYLVTATQTEFHNNRAAGDGGGISANRVYLTDSTFRENYAAQHGSAIAMRGRGSSQINGVTFRDNDGPRYTIHSNKISSQTEIKNSTFVGNVGAAFYAIGSAANNATPNRTNFINTTIAANGRGIVLSSHSTAVLRNTIVAGHGSQTNPTDIQGTVSASHTLFGSPSSAGGMQHGVDGNIVGDNGTGNLDLTTVFVDVNSDGVINAADLADNGGPTLTLALRNDSLAVDAGSNTLATNAGLTTDQRGDGFTRFQGSAVDMGAYEADLRFHWDGNTDGDGDGFTWNDRYNWSGDFLPGTEDDVIIGEAFAGGTIVINSNVTIQSLQSAANVSLSHTLSIASDSWIDGKLTVAGNNQTNNTANRAGTGVLTVQTLDWTAGEITQGETIVEDTLTIRGTSSKTLSGTLTNQGEGQWTGGTIFTGAGGGTFNNLGTFDIQTDSKIFASGPQHGGPMSINNSGLLTKTTTTGESNWQAQLNNTGIVQIHTGTFVFGGGTSTGSFLAEADGRIRFGGTSLVTLDAESTIGGLGTIEFANRTTIEGEGAYAVSGTTDISSGTLLLNINGTTNHLKIGGNNTGNRAGTGVLTAQTLDWTAGEITQGETIVEDTLTIRGTSSKTLSGTLTNQGEGQWTGGTIFTGCRRGHVQ